MTVAISRADERITTPAANRFSAAEWRRLGVFYGLIALLHVLGWGLFLHYSAHYAALVGLGLAAYLFGLRHAFDADHIAAVDDTIRLLMQRGQQRPLGVGFFFSLGHSTVVFLLAVALTAAAGTIKQDLPLFQQVGGLIGASVSGVFLWFIGVLNLLLLLDILRLWRAARRGRHSHTHLEELLVRRGLLNRLFGTQFRRGVTRSWQMYPLGFLFGLGFDTASEVALLAMTAGAAVGDLPPAAVLSLPLLFTAGMSFMDTTDGVLMARAYGWAFVNPLRKIFYNLATTSLSVAVALVIGSVELAQVFVELLHLDGPLARQIAALDFGTLGYYVVGLFLTAWMLSFAVWKLGRFEQRLGGEPILRRHSHEHDNGRQHHHEYFR